MPDPFGQHKTVFLIPLPFKALLVSSGKAGRRAEELRVTDANAALAWCVKHKACLLYMPDPE